MDYSEKELTESSKVFLNELLQLRSGENLLIYVDQAGDYRLARAIHTQAERQGSRTEIFELNSALPLADQAKQLTEKIQQGSFHAICELSEQYFYLTSAWPAAYEGGARVYSLAGLDTASFIRCVGRVNHERMFALGMELKTALEKSRRLRIVTENGTDIRMKVGLSRLQRLMARFRRGPRAFITSPSGFGGGFLGGQLAFLGIPTTIEGTAVIDGYLWPPAEIGLLDRPLIVNIYAGKVVDIGGCPVKSRILRRWFEGQTVRVEHFCIGFNPGASLSGKILEAERVIGCISIGMGQGPFHTDGIINNPSLHTEEIVIEENGSFVTDKLLSLKNDLVRDVFAQ